MTQDYNEYLAVQVLNEQQFINYRSLSRALKVHSNLAKQMLYEFHDKQNAKKPGSVHATYLITGIRKIVDQTPQTNGDGVHHEDDEDTVMQSSPPFPSSSAPKAEDADELSRPIRSVMLVKEEDLDSAKTVFESISSIHIYSLEANGLSDVEVLSECNRKIDVAQASEDPLQDRKQYGTIQNPNARRRTQRTAPPPAAPVAKDTSAKTKPFATAAKAKEAEMKVDPMPTSAIATPEPDKKALSKPAPTKRQNSDIFKSFAKGNAKPKREESQTSAETTPAAETKDEPMGGFSDDDPDDEAAMVANEEPILPSGKSKKDREAELQAMMDQEDESMEDAPTPAEAPDEPEVTIDTQKDEEAKETMTVENGRRRGKRRIMKKKTVKDEEGYLVTKEDWAWESFSEEEPAPKKIKVPPAALLNTGSKTASKKGGNPGQGNIMSFFSKK